MEGGGDAATVYPRGIRTQTPTMTETVGQGRGGRGGSRIGRRVGESTRGATGRGERRNGNVIRKWAFPPPPNWSSYRETVREIGIRKVGRKWKIVVNIYNIILYSTYIPSPRVFFHIVLYVENIRSTENTNFPFQKLPRTQSLFIVVLPSPPLVSSRASCEQTPILYLWHYISAREGDGENPKSLLLLLYFTAAVTLC